MPADLSPLDRHLARLTGSPIVNRAPAGGGCINHAERLRLKDGRALFLKTNRAAPAGMFAAEAAGLAALAAARAMRVPSVIAAGDEPEPFILMEHIAGTPRRRDFWERFGRALALQHAATAERFGFAGDNYIGATPQPNGWRETWVDFFRDQRLLFQRDLARERGLLPAALDRDVSAIADRLDRLLPGAIQPALLHGDLWGGNVLVDESGFPAVVDPAAYYGDGEADLAMTGLFGGFPAAFSDAYGEARRLSADFARRRDIYNLYHLLNHVNLFGEGYLGECRAAAGRVLGR